MPNKLSDFDLWNAAEEMLCHVKAQGVPVRVAYMSNCPCEMHIVWLQEGLNRYHQFFFRDVGGYIRVDVDLNCEFDGPGCSGQLRGVTVYNAAVEVSDYLAEDLVAA